VPKAKKSPDTSTKVNEAPANLGFEAKHAEPEVDRKSGADPEDPDEYQTASIFWVPKEARWSYPKGNAPRKDCTDLRSALV
jgi:hypothetical protein